MKKILALALILVVIAPHVSASAESGASSTAPPSHSPETTLRAAIDREVARLVREESPAMRAHGVNRQAQPRTESWIERHPALFGAFVGAAGGAIMSLAMENELFCSGGDEDCFFHGDSRVLVGAGIGAGVGALVGFLAGR